MKMLELNVAHPNSLVLSPLSNENGTLCNVPNDGWLDFDRLGAK